VANVVAAAEVDRDEATEDGLGGAGRGKDVLGGAGLEERKVAGQGRLDERGPGKVAEDGRGREGLKEGEEAWPTKEAGTVSWLAVVRKSAYFMSKRS